jgi:hypothetical protein
LLAPLGVPGRDPAIEPAREPGRALDPKPGVGIARLFEDPLLAANLARTFASEACVLRLRLVKLPVRPLLVVARLYMLAAARLCVSN